MLPDDAVAYFMRSCGVVRVRGARGDMHKFLNGNRARSPNLVN